MPFKRPAPKEATAATPEQLFSVLPRGKKGHSTLWLHQGDILRSYYDKFRDRPDVAIELPTGTGKTLTGLLIADWNRRNKSARVLYACPTIQLVRQVKRSAERQNIPVVDLSGTWRDWDSGDLLKFERAEAVAIVSYNTIFNSNPRVSDVDTILFDDAHAGEQYVAGSYSMEIDRKAHGSLFESLRSELSDHLPSGVGARLATDSPDSAAWNGVHLILPSAHDGLPERIERIILDGTEPKQNLRYAFSVLDGHLSACMIYVKWQKIYIRPFIPPTFENRLFIGARQRIYLSATLGDSGEIERAFGRQHVARLPLPDSAGTPRSGRRFIVFPSLVKGANPEALTRKLIKKASRAIVLSPSAFGAAAARERLVPEGWEVFGKNEVEESFDRFSRTSNAVAILANRYDGIDLPAETCRSVVLSGYPRATHVQEEFLAVRARATSAMSERIRSRVVQGTGRCTRGPEDYALVIVADVDTTTYLARPDVSRTLDAALQAEIEFGLENSEISKDDLLENVDHFLAQDDEWQSDAEREIAKLQAEKKRMPTEAGEALGASAPHEVRASELAWQGVWAEASAEAADAAQAMAGKTEIDAYRALWLLLSGYYANVAVRSGVGGSMDVADALVKKALAASRPQTWIREVTPFPGLPSEPLPPSDLNAVQSITNTLLSSKFNAAKNIAKLESMKSGLCTTKASTYEPALTDLGKLLGADAFKPAAKGNCDSAWCFENDMWITIEAKSDESETDPLSIDTVRQANTHLKMLAAEREGSVVPFPNAASIIVSPRSRVDSGAVTAAQRHVYLKHVDELAMLADDVATMWAALRQLRSAEAGKVPGLVLETMQRAALLPSDVFQRLTTRPIGAD